VPGSEPRNRGSIVDPALRFRTIDTDWLRDLLHQGQIDWRPASATSPKTPHDVQQPPGAI
jgi:hypothetical protein